MKIIGVDRITRPDECCRVPMRKCGPQDLVIMLTIAGSKENKDGDASPFDGASSVPVLVAADIAIVMVPTNGSPPKPQKACIDVAGCDVLWSTTRSIASKIQNTSVQLRLSIISVAGMIRCSLSLLKYTSCFAIPSKYGVFPWWFSKERVVFSRRI